MIALTEYRGSVSSMSAEPIHNPGSARTFREVNYPSAGTLLFTFFIITSIGIIFASAYGNTWGWVVTNFLIITIAIGIYRTRLIVEVKEGRLWVPGAIIEKEFIGEVTLLNSQGMKLLRGRDANVIAFNAVRFWMKSGIKVEIKDINDPVPYWLISSKRPEKLISAINKL